MACTARIVAAGSAFQIKRVVTYHRATTLNEIGLGGYGQGTTAVSPELACAKAGTIRHSFAKGRRSGHRVESLLIVKASELRNAKECTMDSGADAGTTVLTPR